MNEQLMERARTIAMVVSSLPQQEQIDVLAGNLCGMLGVAKHSTLNKYSQMELENEQGYVIRDLALRIAEYERR